MDEQINQTKPNQEFHVTNKKLFGAYKISKFRIHMEEMTVTIKSTG
jgi:hypothetical protein